MRIRQWAIDQQAEAPSLAPLDQPGHQPTPSQSTEERFWQFFERVNPHLLRPWHFRVYVRQVLLAVGGELRLVFAAPPQHGKTEVTLALIAFLVLEYPGKRWAYVTYNQKRANSVARKFKRLLANAGVVAGGTLAQMYLPNGGQILFTSIDGGITGEPVDAAAFIDDPYKNRKEADSTSRRELVDETYREAIETRVHPGGSIFLLATRWHPQDLSGVLQGEGWQYINLQALAEGAVNDNGVVIDDPNGRQVGEALFPEKWPAEAIAAKRAKVLEFTFSALFQGRPRPKGGKIFHEPTYYTSLPKTYKGGFGLDLAYSAKTSGDWSICVELWREEPKHRGDEPLYYVIRVDRAQVEAPEFALTLKARTVSKPRWRMHWRASGTEKGSASFFKRMKLPLEVHTPPGDKLVSCQHAAPAWNAGRILVPDPELFEGNEDWLYPFLDIIQNFTGSGKEHDDDVDALSTIFDELNRGGSSAYSDLKRGLKPRE
jgi:phage terminase large subunit-like protein